MSLQKGMLVITVEVVQLDDNLYKYLSHEYSKANLECKPKEQ